jgi:hypothetical protein
MVDALRVYRAPARVQCASECRSYSAPDGLPGIKVRSDFHSVDSRRGLRQLRLRVANLLVLFRAAKR